MFFFTLTHFSRVQALHTKANEGDSLKVEEKKNGKKTYK